MEKVMHTTRRLQKKSCIQLVVREKNIHTSYSSISCAYKLYTQVLRESNLCLKISDKIYRSKLCTKVVCISYDIPKIETHGKKKLSRKGKFGRERNESLGTSLAIGR
jgi:hypothetical protein